MYNREQARLIEPDVYFVKRGGEWVVSMNEEDMPSLRLSRRYRNMLISENTDKEVKEYVKERFRSALQLMRNIAQRKSTILRTCEVIVRPAAGVLRQGRGRAEAHDDQGSGRGDRRSPLHGEPRRGQQVRAHAAGRAGAALLLLRGRETARGRGHAFAGPEAHVRKLIADENPKKPLTDDQLAAILHSQGIQLTRRTVAKYREDMNIPSDASAAEEGLETASSY